MVLSSTADTPPLPGESSTPLDCAALRVRGNDRYQEVDISPTFSGVPKEQLYEFLCNCAQQGETQAKRSLRAWIRTNCGKI